MPQQSRSLRKSLTMFIDWAQLPGIESMWLKGEVTEKHEVKSNSPLT